MTSLASRVGEEHFKLIVWPPNTMGNVQNPKEAGARQEKRSCDWTNTTLWDAQHAMPSARGGQTIIWRASAMKPLSRVCGGTQTTALAFPACSEKELAEFPDETI